MLTPSDFSDYVAAGVVDSQDLHGVQELLEMAGCAAPGLAWVALALVIRSSRDGHTCVDFERIDMWAANIDRGDPGSPPWPIKPEPWITAVSAVPLLVRAPSGAGTEPRAPFVLDGSRLYSHRVFDQEERVAALLKGARELHVQVIMGGPGSGKTTWVATQLIERLARGERPSVALAAPTGKAARRMVQVLETTLVRNNAPAELLAAVRESESLTVHKLLEYNPGREVRAGRNRTRPLDQQLVIVDEASMMSLDSMSLLLDAMSNGSTLWLVGDPDQLASVDAGTVLADIAGGRKMVSKITPLTGQHRFKDVPQIGALVEQVRLFDADAVLDILREGGAGLQWVDPLGAPGNLRALQEMVIDHARTSVEIALSGNHDEAVRHKLALQILCGVRRGPSGVSGWNMLVEDGLADLVTGRWYLGRPVLVTENDGSTKLSNGDVGVVCAGADGQRVVAFGEPGTVRTFAPTRLPNVETVHALTIHKSQGSEYDHAVVVLPEPGSRVLTRELLYTGISRPKSMLTLVATEKAIRDAIATPVRRATGLADRL